ncbi:MAG TPA: SpoIID/LytB domain-containing protein, partial [Blastocatellia bacterium]|nr:SpoIID/LytB domain-containing protein [Blastocatellia bacterium]
GLMTDVASISLSAPAGLVMDPGAAANGGSQHRKNARDTDGIAFSSRLRVALAKRAVRVEVARFADSDRALKLASDLRDKYSEPVSLSYDTDAGQYQVLLGDYRTESNAAGMLDRLRHAGYRSAEISNPDPSSRVVARDSDTDLSWNADLLAVKAGRQERVPKMESRDIAAIRDRGNSPPKPTDRIQPRSAIEDPLIKVGDRSYRGEIEVAVNRRGLLNVVNVVPLEDYLRGVVPSEISPTSFPELEALKAQAIAARTYAVARSATPGLYKDEGFDLTDDARSQVYGGYSAEHPLTNRAVEETRGLVATYGGKPIEALYTSTCGGHTENSDAVFPGEPVPYLRAVSCAANRMALDKHQIKTSRAAESLTGADGRPISREFALLDSLGFGMPRKSSSIYLKASAARDELRKWADRAASLTGERRLAASRADVTRISGLASLVANSVFGEAAMLLSPADVDYVLDGLGADNVPHESRADLALLIAAGALKPAADGRITDSVTVTRAQAIETFARALGLRFDLWELRSAGFVTRILASRFDSGSIGFQRAVTAPAEDGRLRITASSNGNGDSSKPASGSRTGADTGQSRKKASGERDGFEIATSAWLLRRFGGESYPVSRLVLIGGETATFHLDSGGRVDFLEIESSQRGAASDRVSSAYYWQVRMTTGEIEQRLARSRVSVGDVRDLVPVVYGESNRVLELEVQGSRGTARLRGAQVRSVLGLKEALFVITRERNREPVTLREASVSRADHDRGPTTFVFTGRGWGHGVGMCQTGAYGLAKEGYSYSAILKTYYSGITIKRMY